MLIDAGLEWGLDARRAHIQVSNAVTDLNILGVQRKKITHVILTHLHYDHAAGLSFTGEHGRVRPTLPNAQIILPREE